MPDTPKDKFYYNPNNPGWHNAVACYLEVSNKWSLSLNLSPKHNIGAHLDNEGLKLFEQIMTHELHWKTQKLGVKSDD